MIKIPKWVIVIGSILIVLFVLFSIVSWIVGIYNNMVVKDQNVAKGFSEIENQLQRRYDLIPSLVEVVKGYAKHEKELFVEVAKARTAWAQAQTPNEKIAAANSLEGFLGRLMVVVEQYPQLKASTNFVMLQDELTGTENRLAVARMRYNETVQDYNTYARRIPNVFFVRMFGFDGSKEFFKLAKEEAREAPKVKF